MLPKYMRHVESNPETLLTRFYGVHRVKPSHGRKVGTGDLPLPGRGPAGQCWGRMRRRRNAWACLHVRLLPCLTCSTPAI